MTATAPSASEPALPPMTHTPHSSAPPEASADAAAHRRARPGLGNQIAENPLLTLFGAIIIVLLGFTLTTTNMRIDDTNQRIDRLEDKMDARFTALEHSVAEIDRKLTALIAALNKTAEVDAAMAGDVSGIRPLEPTGQAPGP